MSATAKAFSDDTIAEVIHQRWSPHSFQDRMVPAGALARLLEAARWAPSSHNEQPWRYLVVTKERPDLHERLAACFSGRSERWAPAAPVLMIASYKTTFSQDGLPNLHALHDLGEANALIGLQAAALGLAVHPVSSIDREAVRAAFAVPEGYQPWLVLALGYPGSPDTLPEDLRALDLAPRERRPLAEIAFSEAWGKSFAG